MLLGIKLLLVTDKDLLRLSRLVAIKIGKSELCDDAEGESILQRLAQGPANHAGKEHVVQLLDRFKLSGPNGRHSCLVTEALAPWIKPEDLSPKAAWEVSKQLVEATAYMHEMAVADGGTCLLGEPNAPICNGADTKIFAYPDIRPRKVLFTRSTTLQPDDRPISYDYWIGQVETI